MKGVQNKRGMCTKERASNGKKQQDTVCTNLNKILLIQLILVFVQRNQNNRHKNL